MTGTNEEMMYEIMQKRDEINKGIPPNCPRATTITVNHDYLDAILDQPGFTPKYLHINPTQNYLGYIYGLRIVLDDEINSFEIRM